VIMVQPIHAAMTMRATTASHTTNSATKAAYCENGGTHMNTVTAISTNTETIKIAPPTNLSLANFVFYWQRYIKLSRPLRALSR